MESWRPIIGFEGMYEVSSCGGVRSLPRVVTRKDGIAMRVRGKTLSTRINNDGYICVQLSIHDKPKDIKVHRAVAQAFLDNPYDKPEVNHKDEDKQNNNVDNLEWCDHSYNSNYGTRGSRISKNSFKRPVVATNPEKEFFFESTAEAARYFEVSSESVRQAAIYGWKCKGYTIRFD